MGRRRTLAMLLGAAAAAAAVVAVLRHGRGAAKGREEQGGILIGDAVAYDEMSRLFSARSSDPSQPTSRRQPRLPPPMAHGFLRWAADRVICRSG